MKQEHFLVVGMNHETAPVEVREKYAVPPEEARRALERSAGRLRSAFSFHLQPCGILPSRRIDGDGAGQGP